jgi:hypothetical protein
MIRSLSAAQCVEQERASKYQFAQQIACAGTGKRSCRFHERELPLASYLHRTSRLAWTVMVNCRNEPQSSTLIVYLNSA